MEQKFSSLGVMEAANHSKNSAMETETHVKHGASSINLMSRGNFLRKVFVFTGALIVVVLTACGGGSGSSGSRSSAITLEEFTRRYNEEANFGYREVNAIYAAN